MSWARLRSEDRGQIGLSLIIVIAWGLTAVVLLTRTLVAAQNINRRVTSITSSIGGIVGETALVAELQKTEKTAADILVAAKPLSPKLEVVDDTAKSIDQTVVDIRGNVETIRSTVVSINGNASAISQTASTINRPVVTAINNQASTILGLVQRIKADTTAIDTEVHATRQAETGIHGHLCRIDRALLGLADGHC